MQTAYVVEAEMIDSQTIHIHEPLELENKKIIVTIQMAEEKKEKKLIKEKFFALAGNIDIDEASLSQLRESSIL